MKKIYNNEWLQLHPYKRTDSVDQYYVGIANNIYKQIHQSKILSSKYEEDIRYISLCLAAWFEDVISQTGIWQAFTAECKRRYGSYLPFYPIKDDYFPDEINLEDVRFLLWHHIQYINENECIINPENPGIEETARKIYNLLEKEYETAPENERMQKFLCHPGMEKDDFFRYREILEWFHYKCYFNIGNIEQFIEESEIIQESENIPDEGKDVALYATHVLLMFRERFNLLSLPSPEWLALISKNQPHHRIWSEVKLQEDSCYLLEKEDDEYLYVKDLCDEDERIFKITKQSLDLFNLRKREIGNSVFICNLVYYNNTWWQCGMLIENKYDQTIMGYVDDLKKERKKGDEKAVYDRFMKASGGKPLVFCKSKEEVFDFLLNKMEFSIAEGVKFPGLQEKNRAILMANPHTGLRVQIESCECIKSPDNPFYNQAKAEKDAIFFMTNPDVVPYELSCMLQDEEMLPDACLNSLQGKEHGKEFIHKNARFLTDYFHHRCREKDLV